MVGVSYPRRRDELISLSVYLNILEVKHDKVCLCFCLFVFHRFHSLPLTKRRKLQAYPSLYSCKCDLLGKAKMTILL